MGKDTRNIRESAPYQIFMIGLCLLTLVELSVWLVVDIPEDIVMILQWCDFAVCIICLLDFFWSFFSAPSKLKYMMTWGWLDLLSSIPTIDFLRVGRAARIFRAVRVLRGLGAAARMSRFLLEKRSQSAFWAAFLLTIVVVLFSSVAVLHVEDAPSASIKGPEDAVAWAVGTLTSAGSEAVYPLSLAGKALGVLLALSGVFLLGVLSGYAASWFLEPSQKKEESDIRFIKEELVRLRQLLVEQRGAGSTEEPPRSS